MIGRSLALTVSLLIGAMLLGISPGFVIDVHATHVTAFTCSASANPGADLQVLCMAPGATICEITKNHPIALSVTGSAGAYGKVSCNNGGAPPVAGISCAVASGSTSCSNACPSLVPCNGLAGVVAIPPPFKATQANCYANAIASSAPVTTTCTIFEK